MTGRCEICGRSWNVNHNHHIMTRKAGAHDIPEAMLRICAVCHSKVHSGAITVDAQLGIALGRDHPDMIEAVKQKVWDHRRETLE